MAGMERTTRICSASQLNPKLLRALSEYCGKNKLGDPARDAVLCCKTVTDRNAMNRIAAWLDGSPNTTEQLGLILTGRVLFWARIGDRSGTIASGANLNDISARPYAVRFLREAGLEICGAIGEKKDRVAGRFAFGPQDDARKFTDAVVQAVETANPPPKKWDIPWLRWLTRRGDKQDR